MVSDSADEDDIQAGFVAEEESALKTVTGWITDIVSRRWRFSDPDSVVQEIVLELVRMARDGRIRSDSRFRAFVATVARHTCIDQYRRQRLRSTVETEDGFFATLDDPGPNPEQVARQKEQREQVRYIIQALDSDCRNLIVWFFGQGLEGGEIARRLGSTPGNVRVRIHRCLQKARRIRLEFQQDVS